MLEILQTKDKTKYVNDFIMLRIDKNNCNVFEATSGEDVIGYGIYYYQEDKVVIKLIKCDDLYIYDGIVRAILFLSVTKGYKKAEFDMAEKERVIGLGFIKCGNSTLDNIDDFMNNCKKCNNKR